MIFVDWYITCRTVNFAGRGANQARHIAITRGLQNVERSRNVSVNKRGGRQVRVGDRDQCSQVQHNLAFTYRTTNEMQIADIARDHLELAAHIWSCVVQPPPRIERIVKDKCADRRTIADQCLHQMGADEAVGTGHQYFLSRKALHCYSKQRTKDCGHSSRANRDVQCQPESQTDGKLQSI